MRFWVVALALVAVAGIFFLISQQQAMPVSGFTVMELAGNSPSLGLENAKATIVEFSDYQCPACLVAQQSLDQVLPQYEGKVRFVYRNFPLYQIHPNAEIAAEAALAAGEQGKFWEMHSALFANQDKIRAGGVAAIKETAKGIVPDEAQFNEALDSRKFAPAVKADLDDAEKFGCEGTPTFFINGKKYFAALSPEQLKQIIDEELSK